MIFGPNMTYKLQVDKDLKIGLEYWKMRQIGFHLYQYLNFTLIWFVRICDLVEITLYAFRNKIVFGDYCYCACLIKCICYCLHSCKNPQFYGKSIKPMTSKSISWRESWDDPTISFVKNFKKHPLPAVSLDG